LSPLDSGGFLILAEPSPRLQHPSLAQSEILQSPEPRPFEMLSTIHQHNQLPADVVLTVANFTSIPAKSHDFFALLNILLCIVIILDFHSSILIILLEFPEHGFPDVLSRFIIEWLVADQDMDS
jgi:hypothetical protein